MAQWQRSRATRDLAFSLFQRSATTEVKERIDKYLGSSSVSDKIKQHLKNLTDGKDTLEKSYKELLEQLLKEEYYDSNSILDNIQSVLSTNGDLSVRENLLAKNVLNDYKGNVVLQNKITSYFENYEKMYNNMIDASESLYKIMDNIRGDQTLYALGTAKTLHLMTTEAYASFEKNNRNLFELTFNNKYELNQLRAKEGYNINDVINGIGTISQGMVSNNLFNYKINNNSSLTYSQVWEELKNTKMTSLQYERNNNISDRAKYVWPSRKLEFLLSGNFNNVSTMDDVKSVINDKQGKINIAENIFGFATGDANVSINGKRYGIQAKYANGEDPWNGLSINGLLNSFTLLSNKEGILQKTINNDIVSSNPDLNKVNNFFQLTFGLNFSKVESRMKEYVYKEIDDSIMEAFKDNPLRASYMASHSYEQLKESILEGYAEEYSEDTEEELKEESDSLEEDSS